MSQYQFPQYAKSTHPDVLQAIQTSNNTYDEFLKRARALCGELTGNPRAGMLNGWRGDRVQLSGLNADEVDPTTLPGQWKKPKGRTIAPYKNNPISERFAALKWQHEQVPGRPGLFLGNGYMGPGTLFIYDGAAYSSIGFAPFSESTDPADGAWEEIKASEFYAAVEAHNERAKKEDA